MYCEDYCGLLITFVCTSVLSIRDMIIPGNFCFQVSMPCSYWSIIMRNFFYLFELSFPYADYNYEPLCIICHISTGFPQTKEMLKD